MADKRFQLMADWAAYCMQPPAADNIVSIGAQR
jgi:hypothetical protein